MRHRIIKHIFTPVVDAAGISCRFPDGTELGHGTPLMIFQSWRDVMATIINPSIGFAEGWGHGRIEICKGDLYDLVLKISRLSVKQELNALSRVFIHLRQKLTTGTEGWTQGQSRRNVHHHYDLGNDFYRLFLDQDWQYSCAYFDDPSITLEEAQSRKKDHIMRKLCLDGHQSVLDIGCGWGGMAMHLAPHAKTVTGITLSEEQLALGRQRVANSSRGQARAKINLELKDYRQETRKFDRIVSVGMLEHVGSAHLKTFFSQVSHCLEDDGMALIHTIGRSGSAEATDSFISKYIFPGGYLPTASELTSAINQTDLAIADMETLFLHYAETLRHWRERFMARRPRVVAMYSEFFARIWELYLAGSEASFRCGNIVVYQLQVLKPKARRPSSRRYLYPPEVAMSPAPEQEYSNLRSG